MSELDPHYLALKDGSTFKIRRSQFRGHVRDGQDQFPIAAFRDIVASGGGLGLCGSAVLAILKEAGQQEPSWPGPGDELDDLAQAVIDLRLVIHGLLDDQPTAPGERPGRAYISERAWGLRHASLCGWAARLAIVGRPEHQENPLLGEAIALREELLARADEIQPRTGHQKKVINL